jgi:hypothetical protein
MLDEARSSDCSVRVEAVRRLADFTDDRAKQALVDALYDPLDAAVTAAAVEAMVKSEDARFVGPLVDAMLGGRAEHSDDEASEVASEVFSSLYEARDRSSLAAEALRREAELNPDAGRGRYLRRDASGTKPDPRAL